MSAINADTVGFWKQLAVDLSAQRPYPGRLVLVTGGRKHNGKRGTVLRHWQDPGAFRYGGEANLHMREMAGRSGFRCQVDTGSEKFWVNADHLLCDPPAEDGE